MTGGITCACTAMAALITPAIPAAALVCPIFAFTLETTAAVEAPRRALASARSSVASPTAVPVPWPSKYATESAPNPAR